MAIGASAAWSERVVAFVAENIALAEPLVFALCFAESIILLSLFVPSTILLVGLGGLYSAAGGDFWPLWLTAAAGAFLGDLITFGLGRTFKKDIGCTWPLRNRPRWYARARLFFRQWGVMGIIGSKFLGMLRPFVPAVAGAMGMRWPLFLLASAISALLWAGAILAPGYGVVAIAG